MLARARQRSEEKRRAQYTRAPSRIPNLLHPHLHDPRLHGASPSLTLTTKEGADLVTDGASDALNSSGTLVVEGRGLLDGLLDLGVLEGVLGLGRVGAAAEGAGGAGDDLRAHFGWRGERREERGREGEVKRRRSKQTASKVGWITSN
jgi:hypothetical protein